VDGILCKLYPSSAKPRQVILDELNKDYMGTYHNINQDLWIDKTKGLVKCKGAHYVFTPVWDI
jgi:hypothetical protein